MNQRWFLRLIVSVLLGGGVAAAQEAEVVVHADQVSHRVSRYLTGACIEDVNHEIYGGLYSRWLCRWRGLRPMAGVGWQRRARSGPRAATARS